MGACCGKPAVNEQYPSRLPPRRETVYAAGPRDRDLACPLSVPARPYGGLPPPVPRSGAAGPYSNLGYPAAPPAGDNLGPTPSTSKSAQTGGTNHGEEVNTNHATSPRQQPSGMHAQQPEQPPPIARPPPDSPTTPRHQNEADSDWTIPQHVPNNWSKGKLIGAGAFGRVFQGLDNETGQILAVKQVALTKDETLKGRVAEHIRSLEAEVHVLSTLNNKNIVRYLGTERTDDTLNIFLEYVPGGSIASLIEKFGPLQESVIRRYTRQILLGLEYLHRKKIMHRDIKGANILVDPEGTVKLADFGASKTIEDLATVGNQSIRGTPYWMAPEVIKQTGHGRPADIWSMACVVIEMATGKHPWSQCNTQVAAMFHIASTNKPPPLPENLSEEAKEFLLQCFNRTPKDRPNATRLLRHPWMQQAVTASTSTAQQRSSAQPAAAAPRNSAVPAAMLQHRSPPSPIKENPMEAPPPAAAAAPAAASTALAGHSGPTAAQHHRNNHIMPNPAIHMPLPPGPLEAGRKRASIQVVAASAAHLPATAAALATAQPAPTAAAAGSPPPAPEAPSAPPAPVAKVTVFTPPTAQQFDTIVSSTSIPAALQAARDKAAAAAGPASVSPPPGESAATDAAAAAELPPLPGLSAYVPPAALEKVMVHDDYVNVRASTLTLCFNPIEEPSWLPDTSFALPAATTGYHHHTAEPTFSPDSGPGLAAIQEQPSDNGLPDVCASPDSTRQSRERKGATPRKSGGSKVNTPRPWERNSGGDQSAGLGAGSPAGVGAAESDTTYRSSADQQLGAGVYSNTGAAGGGVQAAALAAAQTAAAAAALGAGRRGASPAANRLGGADAAVRQSEMRWEEELKAELEQARKNRQMLGKAQ